MRGLDSVSRDEWPNTRVVHWAFDVMVATGFALLGVALWAGGLAWRQRRLPDHRWFLRAAVVAGPLGFIAIESGWVVTEVGRQPWIIHGVMRTADAVTPMRGLVVPFTTFTVVYVALVVGPPIPALGEAREPADVQRLTERIAQFRKMATEDPDNELGHFRLGQLLMDDGQFAEAAKSFERTLELSPHFSKVSTWEGEMVICSSGVNAGPESDSAVMAYQCRGAAPRTPALASRAR